MSSGPTIKKGKSRTDYATPKDFIQAVEHRFGPIAFDLAADYRNSVCTPDRYFGVTQDSLKQDWAQAHGLLWLNPPFDNIKPWALKCADTIHNCRRTDPLLFLTPASVGAQWFQRWVVPYAHVIELEDRLCFDGKNPYPKDCVLNVYYAGITGRSSWRWKT